MRIWKGWVLALCAFAWACSGVAQAEVPKKLTEEQAYQLIARVFGNLHGGTFEYDRDPDSIFYDYQGIGRPGTEGSFGFFSVNPWTGDVWDLWECHKLKRARLPALKAEIRRRFTPTELRQYGRLSRL